MFFCRYKIREIPPGLWPGFRPASYRDGIVFKCSIFCYAAVSAEVTSAL